MKKPYRNKKGQFDKKIKYDPCIRCGSVGIYYVDLGKMGRRAFCPVCWVGLAGCMARDYHVYNDYHRDFDQELNRSLDSIKYFKAEEGKK